MTKEGIRRLLAGLPSLRDARDIAWPF